VPSAEASAENAYKIISHRIAIAEINFKVLDKANKFGVGSS
jgi:hypothetical protein